VSTYGYIHANYRANLTFLSYCPMLGGVRVSFVPRAQWNFLPSSSK